MNIKFSKHRTYSTVTGVILFLFGLLGFAFRTSADLPLKYLFISLILGFWGIVLAFKQ